MSTFTYRPLDSAVGQQIRIVVLQPSDSSNRPIECKLSHASLDDKPQYEALSYRWGDDAITQYIVLDGHDFIIRQNLWLALSHLRLKTKPRHLWIDALCIDQENVEERNSQVACMGRVYTEATRVISFVGHETMQIQMGLGFLRWLNKISDAAMWEAIRNPKLVSNWSAITSLFDQEYWRRVWVTQEIVLAKSVTVCYGTRSIEWDEFGQLSKRITAFSSGETYLPRYVSEIYLNLPARLYQLRSTMLEEPGGWLLEDLLLLCQHSLASDPRDKIYGILGLVRINLEIVDLFYQEFEYFLVHVGWNQFRRNEIDRFRQRSYKEQWAGLESRARALWPFHKLIQSLFSPFQTVRSMEGSRSISSANNMRLSADISNHRRWVQFHLEPYLDNIEKFEASHLIKESTTKLLYSIRANSNRWPRLRPKNPWSTFEEFEVALKRENSIRNLDVTSGGETADTFPHSRFEKNRSETLACGRRESGSNSSQEVREVGNWPLSPNGMRDPNYFIQIFQPEGLDHADYTGAEKLIPDYSLSPAEIYDRTIYARQIESREIFATAKLSNLLLEVLEVPRLLAGNSQLRVVNTAVEDLVRSQPLIYTPGICSGAIFYLGPAFIKPSASQDLIQNWITLFFDLVRREDTMVKIPRPLREAIFSVKPILHLLRRIESPVSYGVLGEWSFTSATSKQPEPPSVRDIFKPSRAKEDTDHAPEESGTSAYVPAMKSHEDIIRPEESSDSATNAPNQPRWFLSDRGQFGLAPNGSKEGDFIVQFQGCDIAAVARLKSSFSQKKLELIGRGVLMPRWDEKPTRINERSTEVFKHSVPEPQRLDPSTEGDTDRAGFFLQMSALRELTQ